MRISILFFIGLAFINGTAMGQFRGTRFHDFPRSVTPKLEHVNIQPVLLWELSLAAGKSHLLSYNPNNDTIFRVFSLPDLKYTGAFGVKGRGPREFLGVSPSSICSLGEFFQIEKDGSIEEIGLPHGITINNNNFQVLNSYKLPGELANCNYAIILNDSMVCCSSVSGAPRQLTCINTLTKKVTYLVDYPTFYHDYVHSSYSHFYTSGKAISLDRSKIVIAYSRLPLISIYDKNGKLLKSTFINEGPRQRGNIEFAENQVRNPGQLYSYYGRVLVTEKYIYASFQVIDYEGPGLQNQRRHTNLQIHIFDWDGNPVGKVNLEKNMTWAPSYDDSKLYLIDPDIENKIFTAPIRDLFK